MKPPPKRALDKDDLLFRLETADRLRILVSLLGGSTKVSKVMGISKSRLGNWMLEKAPQMPSLRHLSILCKDRGCTLDYIFRGEHPGLEATLSEKIRQVEIERAQAEAGNVARIDQADATPRKRA